MTSKNTRRFTEFVPSASLQRNVLQKGKLSSVDSDPEDENDCFICTEPIEIYAVADCDHRTCHLCALRLRSLYKSLHCAYCKTEQKTVIFTHSPTKPFSTYNINQANVDTELGIAYENEAIKAKSSTLLKHNCPDKSCKVACNDYPQLKQHVLLAHKKMLCDLCVEYKKIFSFEHTLFSDNELQRHFAHGDEARQDTGFKGHPQCQFCRTNYYSNDELFSHCRDKHEQCHICVKKGIRDQYYADYDRLEIHYKEDHYLCLQKACLDKKFIVFDSDFDFQAHNIEEHNASRRVHLQFEYPELNRHSHRNTFHGHHERSPRDMSRENRTFDKRNGKFKERRNERESENTKVTADTSSANPAFNSASASASVLAPNSVSASSSSSSSSSVTTNSLPPGANFKGKQKSTALNKPTGFGKLTTTPTPTPTLVKEILEKSIISRHTVFLEKVKDILKTTEKVKRFRSIITDYRNSAIGIDSFFAQLSDLCDDQVQAISYISLGVEELIDNQDKKNELANAWRLKKAAVSHFPALPPAEPIPATSARNVSRVMVIKQKEKRKENTKASTTDIKGAWKATSGSSAQPARTPAPKAAPFVSVPSPSMKEQAPPLPISVGKKGTGGTGGAPPRGLTSLSAFPSLPVATPKHPVLIKMRKEAVSVSNSWGSNPVPKTEPSFTPSKKEKKNKQVLFRVGL
ncbi:hypothetical protein BDF14DRAFT_1885764 [Spinellus fusiger]|nr:hypothetical protein BDF14DRAFT_1885764 [Spinellus fusiger]